MSTHKQNSSIRILHVVGDSRFGGAGRIILGLAQVAQAEGWQVDILTTDADFQEAAREHGFESIDLDVIRREIRPLWDLAGLARLRSFLRAQRYDIVHTHTSKAGFVGRLAARLAGVPVIVHTAHGFAFHENSPTSIRLFYSTLERLASSWCDRVVAVSEFHREWAIRLNMCRPQKITAIPNGIPDFNPPNRADVEQIRNEMGARPGDLIALCISRLAPDKGLEYLIAAASFLNCGRRRIRIAIAGDGPSRNQLKQQVNSLGIAERVIFLGFCNDARDLLAASDIVVLPSLREGLSISLLEAMAAGKPIIATSIGSQREVFSRGQMGHLVPPADAIAIAEGILRLASDPNMRAQIAATARSTYEKYYTDANMLRSYRELYINLLDERSTAKRERKSTSSAGLPARTTSEVL